MRITKVYTRTGDAGKTRLAGGQPVWKDSLRVDAYGTIDELNASVGVVRVMNADVVVIPGSKNTLADLSSIREKGFVPALESHLHQRRELIGICGLSDAWPKYLGPLRGRVGWDRRWTGLLEHGD